MLSYNAARRIVSETVLKLRGNLAVETVGLQANVSQAIGRILAEEIRADRDYPPFDRSTRDGYAVSSKDLSQAPRTLRLIGESKAGTAFDGHLRAGECVQIMTGAPVPGGADAVVMIEFTRTSGSGPGAEVVFERTAQPGQNIVATGSEAQAAQLLLSPKERLSYAELALAAQAGCTAVRVYRRPRVAILSTGDEVVSFDRTPGQFEIRNSNSLSLAAQVVLAGGEPVLLGNAPDKADALRSHIECGLKEDILVLSGGVSMGKYDLVEDVLRELGAQFCFDSVDIRPGRPSVFAVCQGKPVFGLPGNPVSTMVTFELFVIPAIDILAGGEARPLPILQARIDHDLDEKDGLAHFLPASVDWDTGGAVVRALKWQGSGDVAAVAKSNCFVVVAPPNLKIAAGGWVDVLPRRGLL